MVLKKRKKEKQTYFIPVFFHKKRVFNSFLSKIQNKYVIKSKEKRNQANNFGDFQFRRF